MTAPYYSDDTVTLHHGDCLDVLRGLPDNSVDAVVTDPPYGLEFMGKEWDSFRGDAWRNSAGMTGTGYTDGGKRLARPSFGGGDTANPTCATCGGRKRGAKKCACVEPDWRVKGKPLDQRDNNAAQMRAFQEWCEAWSRECLRVLKPGGHMLAFGGTRTFHRLACAVEDAGFEIRDSIAWMYGSGFPKSLNLVAEDGERTGWGTALKPAFEPVVVARKPLTGTVAANVLVHGTGALNIDACRVQYDPETLADREAWHDKYGGRHGEGLGGPIARPHTGGRWPANVVLDETQAAELDEQSGDTPPSSRVTGRDMKRDGDTSFAMKTPAGRAQGFDDQGGASRFFYVAKADASERVRVNGTAHPTVKPLALMRWLVRLVTPPGGTVLEPFAGSGTTVEACILESFHCIAIEREPDYLPLVVQRINRRRNPVEAVRSSGEDGGLFDLLGEDIA